MNIFPKRVLKRSRSDFLFSNARGFKLRKELPLKFGCLDSIKFSNILCVINNVAVKQVGKYADTAGSSFLVEPVDTDKDSVHSYLYNL